MFNQPMKGYFLANIKQLRKNYLATLAKKWHTIHFLANPLIFFFILFKPVGNIV